MVHKSSSELYLNHTPASSINHKLKVNQELIYTQSPTIPLNGTGILPFTINCLLLLNNLCLIR
jgi:hypothetical protein